MVVNICATMSPTRLKQTCMYQLQLNQHFTQRNGSAYNTYQIVFHNETSASWQVKSRQV